MQEWMIYCDGACQGNPGPGGWGAVILFPDNKILELGGAKNTTTNNEMELTAALQSLEKIVELGTMGLPIEIRTDSSYLIQGATSWIQSWRKRGWKTIEGNPVSHQLLWEEIDQRITQCGGFPKVRFTHIRGHSGILGNERADEIAVAYTEGRTPKACTLDVTVLRDKLLPWKKLSPFYLSYINGKLERHSSWGECERVVKGQKSVKYKKIESEQELRNTLERWGLSLSDFPWKI